MRRGAIVDSPLLRPNVGPGLGQGAAMPRLWETATAAFRLPPPQRQESAVAVHLNSPRRLSNPERTPPLSAFTPGGRSRYPRSG
uniref:Uncharacterized protein n=1 Tax=Oryza barthii TaxID=65489 RepID=A0A0D3F6D5_9ORYZ